MTVALDVLSDEYEKKEKCGLFGVWGTPDAAGLCYQGLFAQQHRGQESAGIAVVDETGQINGHTGMGLVSQVFNPRMLREELAGRAAIGHVRRYDRRSLRRAVPSTLAVERIVYLDSVGMLASLGNRLLLRAALPTRGQIAFWDRWMVPLSRRLDPLLGRRFGKTIVAVLRRAGS